MRNFVVSVALILPGFMAAQNNLDIYRATPEKRMNMVHTRLEVRFDYPKARMEGKAWLTLSPHFYATDSAVLDAKGMFIYDVAIVKGNTLLPLKFSYADSLLLRIGLDRVYARGEKPVVYISYTARPNELKTKGSLAINDAKGLYFINNDGKDSTKPIQIWTQGETEATSVWCPTVDKPNQKTTQEISMTVPDKYVTLSNGLLVKQVKNRDGSRTDTWKLDLPHAPYLMFMGVGDYAVIRDKYRQIPVDYYVEKEYAAVAKRIFGNTPEMMGFFSKLLGVEYPWPKYAQMTARDYVSGAMENTTATLHADFAQQNARQLTDENSWETTIAHELFHHWFGDLVTCESFSNLTVNESFADYSEYLWMEYKYGRDAADEIHLNALNAYLSNPAEKKKHLVRFFYNDKEDMFDLVSYQKGGRILHMLRSQLGDSAFFAGLNMYLRQNSFKTAEAHQLRIALEEVSGRDLNPFFNQWFFGSGHPEVEISYGEITGQKFVAVTQKQEGKPFRFPLRIAAWHTGKPATYHEVMVQQARDTFYFPDENPDLFLEADPDGVMLWKKTETKTPAAWAAQFFRKGGYISRRDALIALWRSDTLGALTLSAMAAALEDPYHGIRNRALRYFRMYPAQLQKAHAGNTIHRLALHEPHRPTRATAIDVLAKTNGAAHGAFFEKACHDSSYSVAGAALEALVETDQAKAEKLLPKLEEDASGRLLEAVALVKMAMVPETSADSLIAAYKKMPPMDRLASTKGILFFARKIMDPVVFKLAVTPVADLYKRIPEAFGTFKADIGEQLHALLTWKKLLLEKNPRNEKLTEQTAWLEKQL